MHHTISWSYIQFMTNLLYSSWSTIFPSRRHRVTSCASIVGCFISRAPWGPLARVNLAASGCPDPRRLKSIPCYVQTRDQLKVYYCTITVLFWAQLRIAATGSSICSLMLVNFLIQELDVRDEIFQDKTVQNSAHLNKKTIPTGICPEMRCFLH